MALLDKAAILAAEDLPTRIVPVPEWGGDVRIRMLTAAQLLQLETELHHARGDGKMVPDNWRELHLVMSVVDDQGKPLFSEADAAALGRKSAKALKRVFEAINAFNSGELEETAKNS